MQVKSKHLIVRKKILEKKCKKKMLVSWILFFPILVLSELDWLEDFSEKNVMHYIYTKFVLYIEQHIKRHFVMNFCKRLLHTHNKTFY